MLGRPGDQLNFHPVLTHLRSNRPFSRLSAIWEMWTDLLYLPMATVRQNQRYGSLYRMNVLRSLISSITTNRVFRFLIVLQSSQYRHLQFDGDCRFLRSEHSYRTAFTDNIFDHVGLILMVWIVNSEISPRGAGSRCSVPPGYADAHLAWFSAAWQSLMMPNFLISSVQVQSRTPADTYRG